MTDSSAKVEPNAPGFPSHLGGVDETTFMKEQDEQGGSDKALGAGSDN